ncbi:MAG TPA: hypothetical protein VF476_08680 [Chitinophagaceae bacterium]
MRILTKVAPLLFCCLLLSALSFSQDSLLSNHKLLNDYQQTVADKATTVSGKLDKQSTRMLNSFERMEAKMKRKLSRIDSARASQLFAGSESKLSSLKEKTNLAYPGQYIPSLDTMMSSLRFLEQPDLSAVNELGSQFNKADAIRKFLKERKQLLQEQLSQYGFAKELKRLNKSVYYYSQQINEFKSLLKDKKKREKKALELLSNSSAFKEFMRKNSQLASLFRLPGNGPSSTADLAGLQTRASVNNLIQQQVGANGMQQFQQNMQAAQSQLQQLKNKIQNRGSDGLIPEGFKPNNQKTKSFWKRLEYGTNIQTVKSNGLLPVTSDVGLSLGYKLSDRSAVGIGASYKMGWGSSIRNINITHQGVGLRSYADMKIKGSFWLTGGYELNYRSAFENFAQLEDKSKWQQSGLIGLSKVVSLRTKFFKKTKLQLLWDFLSYEQVPKTQAVVFRVGYTIK